MNTPEIQARIERLNREHPPAKGMEWRAIEGDFAKAGDMLYHEPTGEFARKMYPSLLPAVDAESGFWFRQVPAEAKEEDSDLIREAEACAFAWLPEGKPDPEPLIYAYRAGYLKAARAHPTPVPGLDYERLFEVLPEEWTAYAMERDGCVFAHKRKPDMGSRHWVAQSDCAEIASLFLLRNLPANWTKSLRAREPKPEPDVEPDEKTEFGAHVEVMTDFGWQAARFIGFRGCTDDMPKFGCVPDGELAIRFYARCRLRREGK